MADENVLDDNISTIDQAVMVGKHESIFNFENKSSGDIGESINRLFIKKGYKLENGTKVDGTYGKGSKIARALLGAFIKRFAFSVKVKNEGETTKLIFSKDGKGYMGGAIGVAQVKKEYNSIISILENYHSKTSEG